VADDGAVLAGDLGELSAVAGVALDVADDGSLGHGADGQHVADGEHRLLTEVQGLARVDALGGDDGLVVLAVLVRVAEAHRHERRTPSGVVHDLSDHATQVAAHGWKEQEGRTTLLRARNACNPLALATRHTAAATRTHPSRSA